MKRSLQVTIALLSLLPLSFGLIGVFAGVQRFEIDGVIDPNLDSQYRFLSAWYLALAVLVWWMIPNLERHTFLFRVLVLAVFCGGLARLLSIQATGLPDTRFLIVLAAELLCPLLIPWQARLRHGPGGVTRAAALVDGER